MNRLALSLIFVVCASISSILAQDYNTLFQYPTAPDTCTTTESRFNYVTDKFWSGLDLARPIDDSKDSLLAVAMYDYLQILSNANRNVALTSIRSLMFNAQANKTNFVKLLAIAEGMLYATPTQLIDDIYLAFARAGVNSTALEKRDRDRFAQQVARIEASKLGSQIHDFTFTSRSGKKMTLSQAVDTAQVALIFFTENGVNSSIAATRLQSDVVIDKAVKEGKLRIVNILCSKPNNAEELASLPQHWVVGYSTDVADKLDIRFVPSFFEVDNKLTVLIKHLDINRVLQYQF